MLRPAPPSIVALLAVIGHAVAGAPAAADPVNILMETANAECVAVDSRDQNALGVLGTVRWQSAAAMWRWNDPPSIYIVCINSEHDRDQPLTTGGGSLFDGVTAWAGALMSMSGATAATSSVGSLPTFSPFTDNTGVVGLPTSPVWNIAGPPPGGAVDEPVGLPLPFGSSGEPTPAFTTVGTTGTIGTTGTDGRLGTSGLSALNSPPTFSSSDPLTPTPEPGSVLLMGTGILLAWRALQKH